MVVSRDADRRKMAVWVGLEALGRSRPHLLLDGGGEASYLARWHSSPVPAHVLAGRLRRALPGSTILSLRSWPRSTSFGKSAQKGKLASRHHVAIEFALRPEGEVSQEGHSCAAG